MEFLSGFTDEQLAAGFILALVVTGVLYKLCDLAAELTGPGKAETAWRVLQTILLVIYLVVGVTGTGWVFLN